MAAYMVDALIDEQVQKLQDDPRELRRYKDFSLYADLLPFIPINMKLFIQSQLGIDRDFTELDFTPREIAELDKMIFEQGLLDPAKIDYDDYNTGSGYSDIARNVAGITAKKNKVSREEVLQNPEKYNVSDPETGESISVAEAERRYPGITSPKRLKIKDLANPAFILKTTLGKADVLVDENNNIIIKDTYDFGTPETNAKEREFLEGVGLGDNPAYELVRRVPLYNFLNTPSSVNINLGTREDYEKRKARQNKASGGLITNREGIESLMGAWHNG
jgi:hypothetical protein